MGGGLVERRLLNRRASEPHCSNHASVLGGLLRAPPGERDRLITTHGGTGAIKTGRERMLRVRWR